MVNPKNNSDTCSKENKTLAVGDDLLGRKRIMNDECEYESWLSLTNMKAAPALWRFYCMRENRFTYYRFLFVFEAIESKRKKLRQKN